MLCESESERETREMERGRERERENIKSLPLKRGEDEMGEGR